MKYKIGGQKSWLVFITERPEILGAKEVESTDVYHTLLRHLKENA